MSMKIIQSEKEEEEEGKKDKGNHLLLPFLVEFIPANGTEIECAKIK
jgi:hypothetical protein